MRVTHPDEIELARSSDGQVDESCAAHLRWCARCRTVAADHRWMQKEVQGVMAVAAESAPLPRPRWRAVRDGMRAARRRQVVREYAFSFAGVVLAACLLLLAPGFLDRSAALGVDRPGTPALSIPAAPPSPDNYVLPVVTPTPLAFVRDAVPAPTPPVVLPPTPPQVET